MRSCAPLIFARYKVYVNSAGNGDDCSVIIYACKVRQASTPSIYRLPRLVAVLRTLVCSTHDVHRWLPKTRLIGGRRSRRHEKKNMKD